MLSSELWELAARQKCLLTSVDLSKSISRKQLDRLVSGGLLLPERKTVFRLAWAPPDPHRALLAACLAGGDDVLATRVAAGALWGLRGLALGVPEVLSARPRALRLADVLAHTSTLLPVGHRTVHDGVPVTTVARTILDLSAAVSPWLLARILDDAVRRRLTTYAEVRACLDVLACRGRRKVAVVRELLDRRADDFHPGDSDGELQLVSWLITAGFPPPVQQHQVVIAGRVYVLDLAFPPARLDIEYNGQLSHAGFTANQHDRMRRNALTAAGWTVLDFDRTSSRREVVDTVGAALDRLSVTNTP